MGMVTVTGDDCVDVDHALNAGKRIDTAVYAVQSPAEGITDLAKGNEPHGILVADPFQRHTGDVCPEYLLLEVPVHPATQYIVFLFHFHCYISGFKTNGK
jgi:hypothetical protein